MPIRAQGPLAHHRFSPLLPQSACQTTLGLAACAMSVRFQSPEFSQADEFYLALERYVTHHAGETNSLAHGKSRVTMAAVVFSVPRQIRLRISRCGGLALMPQRWDLFQLHWTNQEPSSGHFVE